MLPPRPSTLPRGPDGLPIASPLERRVSRVVVIVATLWFTLAAAWELFGPMLAGHYASSASMGIIAENMLRWGIAGPVWEYTTAPPKPAMYYCHHPWGIFWTTAAFMKVLGRHDFVCRLPAVLLSAATPPLLYAIGRAVYRPAAGAAAAAAFTVLPITLAFASFNALEVPVMAWTLLGLWGYVRLTQTWRKRHLAASVIGLSLALNSDWPALVLVGGLLGFGALRAFALPRALFGPVRERRYAQWWVLTAAAAALTLAMYLYLFRRSDKLEDLLQSYGARASGNQAPLSKVLQARRYWIELSFTPIAIALGKLGAGLCLARLAVLRREHDALPLLYLAMAVVQYVVFRQGADIHVFWPHYFGAYFALAMAALTATAAALLERLRRRRAAASRPIEGPANAASRPIASATGWPAAAALGIALVPLAAVLRDGIPALRYARATGGRFNEKGLLIHSDGDKTAALRWLAARLPASAPVEMHESMKMTWAQTWALDGRVVTGGRPVPKGPPRGAYVVDTRFMDDAAQADLARRFHVAAVGPIWILGLRAGEPGIETWAIREREPSLLEWYFLSGTEPAREIAPDPFLAWELRTHFGQPAEAPAAAPATLEQRRIAHNVALAAGDAAAAARLSAEIEASLTTTGARFEGGVEIVGTTFAPGARPLLTILVRAGGPMAPGVTLSVRSKVIAAAPLSTTMADPVEREVGLPTAIAPERWRAGYLYADPVPIQKRPGTEVFRASFTARGGGAPPARIGGGPAAVEVLRLR